MYYSPAVNHIALKIYINIHGSNSAKTILQHLKFGEVDLNSPEANIEKSLFIYNTEKLSSDIYKYTSKNTTLFTFCETHIVYISCKDTVI
jgi:hypothetical protein